MAPARAGGRMGGWETTPPSPHPGPAQRTPPATPTTSRLGSSPPPIIGHRLPASSPFVLAPRPSGRRRAAGAPASPRTTRRHEHGSCEESQHTNPARRQRAGHRASSPRSLDKRIPHGWEAVMWPKDEGLIGDSSVVPLPAPVAHDASGG